MRMPSLGFSYYLSVQEHLLSFTFGIEFKNLIKTCHEFEKIKNIQSQNQNFYETSNVVWLLYH